MKSIMRGLVAATSLFAAFCVSAEEAKTPPKANVATNAVQKVDFATVCAKGWLKGVTDKDAMSYAIDEDIEFTISLEGVTNAIPKGAYRFKWKRTGDDGTVEEGVEPLESKKFSVKTKTSKPGFVRMTAELVDKEDKPFTKLVFRGGAGVDADQLVATNVVSKKFAQHFKDLPKKLVRTPFKNVERGEVPAIVGLKDAQAFAVSFPYASTNLVTGYLVVPNSALKEIPAPAEKEAKDPAEKGDKDPAEKEAAEPVRPLVKAPARLCFLSYTADRPLVPPKANQVVPTCVTFFMGYPVVPKENRDEAYCDDLYLRMRRSIDFVKSLPEWNGTDLDVRGSCCDANLSLLAAASDAGVTAAAVCNIEPWENELFDPLTVARYLKSGCLVDIVRSGLGDDVFTPNYAAQLWNAMTGDKKITWMQGAYQWYVPRSAEAAVTVWEKIVPLQVKNLDAAHYQPYEGKDLSFKDVELSLRDKFVIEVVFDYNEPKTFDTMTLSSVLSYARQNVAPLAVFAVIPERKVKAKAWDKFCEYQKNDGAICPIYLDAGYDLPTPTSYPWYYLVDQKGILRYSGNKLERLGSVREQFAKGIQDPDPVFAYAHPKLLKDTVKKLTDAKLAGAKLYKALEVERKKAMKKDPARADEAEHLMFGLRQGAQRRLAQIELEYKDRPGRALNQLKTLTSEWPDLSKDPRVDRIQQAAAKTPELAKVAKVEGELTRVLTWRPEKKADIRQKDMALAALRQKIAKMAKSKVSSIQSEAMMMQADLDNPPQDQQEAQ